MSKALLPGDDRVSTWVAAQGYEREQWDEWEKELTDPKQGATNFIPSPLELKVRMEIQKYLTINKFPSDLIESVMVHDQPEFWLVVRLHKKYGTKGAYKKLKPFLIRGRYGLQRGT